MKTLQQISSGYEQTAIQEFLFKSRYHQLLSCMTPLPAT